MHAHLLVDLGAAGQVGHLGLHIPRLGTQVLASLADLLQLSPQLLLLVLLTPSTQLSGIDQHCLIDGFECAAKAEHAACSLPSKVE